MAELESFYSQPITKNFSKSDMTDYFVTSDDDRQSRYVCMWVDNPVRLKCGKCLRGIICREKIGGSLILRTHCRVCGAFYVFGS